MLGRGGGGGYVPWTGIHSGKVAILFSSRSSTSYLIKCYSAQNHFLLALNELFIVPYFCRVQCLLQKHFETPVKHGQAITKLIIMLVSQILT